jgi:hypothetical protein
MGVFLAYFLTWLKFHELFRLGAYVHPFDFISNIYTNDLKASDQYFVHGASWEAKFGALKDFGDPFVLLPLPCKRALHLAGHFFLWSALSAKFITAWVWARSGQSACL